MYRFLLVFARALAAPWFLLTLLALTVSCHEEDGVTGPSLPVRPPSLAISDAAHGGKSHFYFLPPILPAPAFSGVFDAALSPEVRVCRLAGATCDADVAAFSPSTSPTVTLDPVGEAYKVVWQTKGAGLLTAETYRIQVLVGPVLLGFADLRVVSSNKDLDGLPQDVVGLVEDKTLQIKFRIEKGFVGTIRVVPGSQDIEVHATQQYAALLFDLHGNPLPGGGPVTWTSSDLTVLTIDQNGLATGQGIGTALVSVASEGLTPPPATARVYRRLAFASDRSDTYEVFTMWSDGSHQTQLTHNSLAARQSAWSPDGSRIAFDKVLQVTGDVVTEKGIFLMNPDGTGVQQLTSGGIDHGPVWSPDGTALAFSRCFDDICSESELYLVNADGTGLHSVSGAAPGFDDTPRWSADGRSIAFVTSRNVGTDNTVDIYTVRPDGTGLARRTFEGDTEHVCWAPGGDIVFQREVDLALRVARLDPSTGTVTVLASTGGLDMEPCWSPDASRIVFTKWGNVGEFVLYLMDANGGSLFQLTAAGMSSRDGVWSPDGKRIAYSGVNGIHSIAPDGSEDTLLTSGGDNEDYSFRP